MGVPDYDIENGGAASSEKQTYTDTPGAVRGESFEYGNGFYAKVQRLAGKLKIEQRGIERVPEDERNDTSILNVGSMWLAANMVVSSFAIGVLGTALFGCGFVDSILTILFFNIIGALPVAYFSTFGPVFGLRQMVLSRFWFGWYGVKIIAFFNVLACLGWSAVNVIVGAELIHTVNSDVPDYAGIIIIAIITFLITLFGYKVVHTYEFWSWIPCFIIFLIVLGVFAHSGDFSNVPWTTGKFEAGNVLSFGATVYGFATGWTSYAADYTVYQPPTQNRLKVFLSTLIGVLFPLFFTEMLGAAVITASTTGDPNTNPYMVGYKAAGTGGLLGAVLVPRLGRFGEFCLVILALSIIANNCPNIYSVSLSLQVMARWTQRVPRFIWTLIATGVYIAISIPGYNHFEAVLENFMNFIGYWLAIYEGISLPEHWFFKKGISGYVPENYDKPGKLPVGIAAITGFLFGVLGAVMGMAQVWFIGPIAKHTGNPLYGGDIGSILGFSFAFVTYCAMRPIELKYFGR
ncbi:purine-cytosine permease [Xylona heveae TC161]|uniref:Purine-cytosine permease n=1 Tax=Xylona heveae (strain CBS 132557 / TC161) TaxID=1328760 RepID=A0A161TQ46_XYLHT|nr:purine-cytosine permease [Xylona heveae TC161]KZF24416.1 purine-cytosine permease [Xylona heveae TC161]